MNVSTPQNVDFARLGLIVKFAHCQQLNTNVSDLAYNFTMVTYRAKSTFYGVEAESVLILHDLVLLRDLQS